MSQPGIMLYFDNIDPLRQLSNEELGQLFLSVLEYGKDGTVPQFSGMLAMAWAFLQPKIDRDAQKYAYTVSTKRYGTYCREAARRGESPISHEYWDMLDEREQKRLISGDTICYPTTITSPTVVTAQSEHKHAFVSKTDHRRTQVSLSAYQMDTLRAKMGADLLNCYLDKLQDLLRADPSFEGNHYLTILGWWNQGSQD